jgi:hypothetical protein
VARSNDTYLQSLCRCTAGRRGKKRASSPSDTGSSSPSGKLISNDADYNDLQAVLVSIHS